MPKFLRYDDGLSAQDWPREMELHPESDIKRTMSTLRSCGLLSIRRRLLTRIPPLSVQSQARSIFAFSHPTFPLTSHTPTSKCECDDQIPPDLDIDHNRDIANTVAPYNQHIVISTGKSDWASRIEDEEGPGNMAKIMKNLLRRGGGYHRGSSRTPQRNATPSTKDVQPPDPGQEEAHSNLVSLKLFPHFLGFPYISSDDSAHLRYFTSKYLSSQSPTTSLVPRPQDFSRPQPINRTTVLICSHNTRDRRCGIIGPILYRSFTKRANPDIVDVGMISHVGGHAFAGNVIIYTPPGHKISPSDTGGGIGDSMLSPLAGTGVWYGRVEPKHVRGILDETVNKGKIIAELWRGGLQTVNERKGDSSGDWEIRAATARMMRMT
ncbi:MAG: hypothetical protein Q9218_006262 [Villophora microphyllina]